jgi:hypothetical protein
MGLGEDMNKTLRQHGIQYKVKEHLGMILAIFLAIMFVIPPIGLLLFIPWLIILICFFKDVKDGAIALLEQNQTQPEPLPSAPASPVATDPMPIKTAPAIEIIINGTTQAVTKQELFGLVTSGKVNADTPVSVDGKLITVEMAMTMN